MTITSRIRIRHTAGGGTIRATGAAAQALADAITHGAESVQAETSLAATRVLPLQIAVADRNNTYEARAVAGAVTASVGLKGVKATCTAGRRQAVQALLAKAVPPRRLARVVSYEEGAERTETYIVEAEVA